MKKLLLFLISFTFLQFLYAQSHYVSIDYSDRNSLIEIENDTPSISYEFTENGAPPLANVVELNGYLYGVAGDHDSADPGWFYRFDYANEIFEPLTNNVTGGTNISNLISSNNIIYTVLSGNSLVEFDPLTNNLTTILNFNSVGITDFNHMLYASNNKIYGVSRTGGSSNQGVLFSYNLTTNSYQVEFNFNDTDGHWVYHIIEHSNGNIYGAGHAGGINGYGVIFEFNTTTNTYSKLYDLSVNERADNLVEGDSNMLYGFTYPTSGGGARIYQYNISANEFTNLHYFTLANNAENGTYYGYHPLVYKNNILYGKNRTVFFNLDLNSNTFGSDSIVWGGGADLSPLIKTSDERIFFTTFEGAFGKLMEYDTGTNSINEVNGTEFGTKGLIPYKIIKASTGLIYGITTVSNYEPSTYGVNLFSFNANTNEYNSLITFGDELYGNAPRDIIETADGLIYIYTSTGNSSGNGYGQGKLIEYNPATGLHSIAHEFGDLFTASTLYENLELFEMDNIIYGIKRRGANNSLSSGTIFSYDTLTHIYSVLYESADLTENVETFLSSSGIIYGVTTTGGANNAGYLHSYDTQTNQFTIVSDLDTSGIADITETSSGEIFGVLENSHGEDGSIFKINSSQEFSIEYVFNNNTLSTGFKPYLIKSFGDKLYILNKSSFTDVWGNYKDHFIDYDTTNSNLFIVAGNVGNGADFESKLYVMNDGRVLSKISASLLSYYTGDNNVQTVFQSAHNLNSIIDMNNSNGIMDDDYDGVLDFDDLCPNTPLGETVDINGCSDGQLDDDNDGIINNNDVCPDTPTGESVDANGCSYGQLDDDNDGVQNSNDLCSETPIGESVNTDGCSESQLDDDNDGIMNNIDDCPDTPTGESVNTNGCSESQLDDDNDGVMNNADNCPDTPTGESVNTDGCSDSQIDDDNDGIMNNIDECPNTPSGVTVNTVGCIVLPSNNFSVETISETCVNSNNGQIIITTVENHNYSTTINGDTYNFTNSLTVENLSPNQYGFCITVNGTDYEQCFNIEIESGVSVSGKISSNSNKASIEVTKGTAPYKVFVNGLEKLNTYESSFIIEVNNNDLVEVKTSKDCEGVFSRTITNLENILAYPNPNNGLFELYIPTLEDNVELKIYTISGQLIIENKYPLKEGKVMLDINNQPSGIYFINAFLENSQNLYNIKIIKK